MIYADFECFLVETSDRVSRHEPSGFAAIRVANDPKHTGELHCYSGPDADADPTRPYSSKHVIQKFYEYLRVQEKYVRENLDLNMTMSLAPDEELDFEAATECYICDRSFKQAHLVKNRDHDHQTSRYRGAACSSCNLKLKFRTANSKFDNRKSYFIPVVLHGGSNYDFKLILKQFSKVYAPGDISVVPTNTERYIGFQIGNLRFIDSCKFLNASLEALVQNLAKSGSANTFPAPT